MSDEENKTRRRRFNPSLIGGAPTMPDPNVLGVVGQMLGGIGTGLGAGLANKMNERVMLAGLALNGLLSDSNFTENPNDAAVQAQQYADALLMRLEEVPDPRYPDAEMPAVQKAAP